MTLKFPLRIDSLWLGAQILDADSQPVPLESLVAAVNEAGRYRDLLAKARPIIAAFESNWQSVSTLLKEIDAALKPTDTP